MSLEIPKTFKKAVFESNGAAAKYVDGTIPEIGHDEALVKVLYAGVCHTDLAVLHDELPWQTPYPYVGGHEGSGVVVKVGAGVTHVKPGSKVGIRMVNGMCNQCESCLNNREYICINQKMVGIFLSGTFEQYTALKAQDLLPLPENIDLAAAAPIMCAGVTAYRALKKTNPVVGQFAAIIGAGGGVGSFAVQYAKALGLRVVAIDHPSKREHCLKIGAEVFIDGFSEKIVEEVQTATAGGAHVVINFTASPKAVNTATQYVRAAGTIVLVGAMDEKKGTTALSLDNNLIATRCLTVTGSMTGTRQDTKEALDLSARGVVKIPIEVRPFSALDEALHSLKNSAVAGRVVLDLWK
ncbi:unnamed protein product [Bursaphelenchus xylophilus]|uniref:alcohol dehydrogenase n=1 Tax=Bursaphelenchus xylophilus TaxID=6326 RepID=A0A1I7RW16_BURXY|nr:unnamed protein product [Bursaphelenchus xylophilus]CAG9095010.1 unnamed protein product [Bursaphelenchus xylophilus]